MSVFLHLDPSLKCCIQECVFLLRPLANSSIEESRQALGGTLIAITYFYDPEAMAGLAGNGHRIR